MKSILLQNIILGGLALLVATLTFYAIPTRPVLPRMIVLPVKSSHAKPTQRVQVSRAPVDLNLKNALAYINIEFQHTKSTSVELLLIDLARARAGELGARQLAIKELGYDASFGTYHLTSVAL